MQLFLFPWWVNKIIDRACDMENSGRDTYFFRSVQKLLKEKQWCIFFFHHNIIFLQHQFYYVIGLAHKCINYSSTTIVIFMSSEDLNNEARPWSDKLHTWISKILLQSLWIDKFYLPVELFILHSSIPKFLNFFLPVILKMFIPHRGIPFWLLTVLMYHDCQKLYEKLISVNFCAESTIWGYSIGIYRSNFKNSLHVGDNLMPFYGYYIINFLQQHDNSNIIVYFNDRATAGPFKLSLSQSL